MADIRSFILKNVTKHPKNIVGLTMQKFGLSRPAVYKHVKALIEAGELVQDGTKSGSIYSLAFSQNYSWTIVLKGDEREDDFFTDNIRPLVKDLPKNVYEILYYCFTEMLNNAFDHATAKNVYVNLSLEKAKVIVSIEDDGIGIFEKISKFIGLVDRHEAVLELSKGKFTTAQKYHSGQGIFFTSRAVSKFSLEANGLMFMVFSRFEDWTVTESDLPNQKGTIVSFEVEKTTSLTIREVFEKYATSEDFKFDKTDVKVHLLNLMEAELISRSQAKRLIYGLDKFDKIILDFKKVRMVGQGFCDEVFRVFKSQHPHIEIECVNTNRDIEFMIKHSGHKSR